MRHIYIRMNMKISMNLKRTEGGRVKRERKRRW
jgi:hypothetical protein